MTLEQLHDGSWHLLHLLDQAPGFRALSAALIELAERGDPVVVGTADLKYSNGLVLFQREYPERFVQFGVSEQNMVSAAAGMAAAGMRPHVATFASFLALLCCEQIRTDVAYTGLPVRLIGHHAGITLGFYGTSHHATEDLAIMRAIAGIDVLAPADPASTAAAIRAYAEYPGPMYMRIGRGRDPVVYDTAVEIVRGGSITHSLGTDVTLLATGSMVHPCLEARNTLETQGYSVGVADMYSVKPLDSEAVEAAAASSSLLVTIEEHNVIGGLGAAVAELLTSVGSGVRLHRHGIPDEYSLIGPPTHLYRHYRLDAEGIAAVVKERLDGTRPRP